MEAWWTGLTALNQTLYVVAIFFSTLFLWQFVTALIGLGGSIHLDIQDTGPEVDDSIHDHGTATFKLLSVRAVIAFGMLFGWAGAMYLQSGMEVAEALLHGLVWGAAGMFVVAYFFYKIQHLSESGTQDLETCVGTSGEVYIDIPEDGAGQVRVMESGAVNFVAAKGRDGIAIPHKTPVHILRTLDMTTVEVEPANS